LEPKDMLTVAEAAAMLETEHQKVLNRVKRGQYKGAKKDGWFWYIPRKTIESELKKKKA